jgi:hypothetical protein
LKPHLHQLLLQLLLSLLSLLLLALTGRLHSSVEGTCSALNLCLEGLQLGLQLGTAGTVSSSGGLKRLWC